MTNTDKKVSGYVMFRDKTQARDLSTVIEKGFWDNTARATKLEAEDKVIITSTKGAFKRNRAAWLLSPAIVATATGEYVKVDKEDGTVWSSGKGGYFHRYILKDIETMSILALAVHHAKAFLGIDSWQQGSVRYIKD